MSQELKTAEAVSYAVQSAGEGESSWSRVKRYRSTEGYQAKVKQRDEREYDRMSKALDARLAS